MSATALPATVDPLGHGADARRQGVLVDAEVGSTALPAGSAASTSIGVRLFAASAIPVIALVSPQPWCTDSADRARRCGRSASAIVAAPALVAGGDEPARRGAQGVGDGEVAAADDAEGVADAQGGEHRPTASATLRRDASPFDQREHPRRAPDPPTIGSGATTSTAPVGGSWARCCRLVRPHLPAPIRKWWHGNGGSKPRRGARVGADGLDAEPGTGESCAIHRAPRRTRPGCAGRSSSALVKAPGRAPRAPTRCGRAASRPRAAARARRSRPDVVDARAGSRGRRRPRRSCR